MVMNSPLMRDNWLPDSPEWRKFAAKEHLAKYLELIGDQMGKELSRACSVIEKGVLQIDPENDWERIGWDREDEYSLSRVETLSEFPADNPITTVWELGTKLMHLSEDGRHRCHARNGGQRSRARLELALF